MTCRNMLICKLNVNQYGAIADALGYSGYKDNSFRHSFTWKTGQF